MPNHEHPDQHFGSVPADADLDAIARLPALAFGTQLDQTRSWYTEQVGTKNLRILTTPTDTGEPHIDAALGQVPLGLYIYGKRIDHLGVLGVAVAPESRGKGHARTLMRHAIRAMHADRVPLSMLYSAMHPLYRGVGYEIAGVYCQATVPASLFPKPKAPDDGTWVETTPDDQPVLDSIYEHHARTTNGMLARTPYIWNRIRERAGNATGFLHTAPDETPDAYAYLVQKHWAEPIDNTGTTAGVGLILTDIAWSSPAGLHALSGFLRGYSSVGGTIECRVPINSQLLTMLPDWRYAARVFNYNFLRITHLEAALTARGYSPATTATITLDITDDTIPEHTGLWTLAIDRGAPTVAQTTKPTAHVLTINTRDLAPLYTGYTSPRALRDAGLATCDDHTADLAAGIFATPSIPAMTDMF